MRSLFETADPTVRAGSLPTAAQEPRPAALLSAVNYSRVSGEEIEEGVEVGRARRGWMREVRHRWLDEERGTMCDGDRKTRTYIGPIRLDYGFHVNSTSRLLRL